MGLLDWYKDGLFWRKKSPEWEFFNYGNVMINSKGDLGSNTMMRIVDSGDDSSWAFLSLSAVRDLLLEGKRWPDRMNQDVDAETRIEWRLSQLKQLLLIKKTVKYRPQHQMTRDPYIYFYTACIMLGREDLIELVKMPWYLYRPGTWAWRKCLINETWWNRLIYKIDRAIPATRRFTQRLKKFKKMAYNSK